MLGFPGGSVDKESACNVGDLGLIPALGGSPSGGHGNTLQYSCLENPHGRRSLVACSRWVTKSRRRLTKHSTAHVTLSNSPMASFSGLDDC